MGVYVEAAKTQDSKEAFSYAGLLAYDITQTRSPTYLFRGMRL